MNRWMRFFAALGICLSGWALIPFASFPRQAFGWEMYAGAYQLIFADDLESGTTTNWDQVIGEVELLPAEGTDSYQLLFQLDPTFWKDRKPSEMAVLDGLSPDDSMVFSMAVRPAPGGFDVRITADRDSSKVRTSWRRVPADAAALGLEWQRALAGGDDGHLYLTVDGRLTAWLVDLANSRRPLSAIAVHKLDGRSPLVDLTAGRYGTQAREASR